MPTLDREDDVYLLDVGGNENRWHPAWLTEMHDLLEKIEKNRAKALVTTASGKVWSTGLDLEWLAEHPDQFTTFTAQVHTLLARMLTLPMVTVAALQGHTFAAGAMFSLAHDLRVMRADRGYWCLPEADIDIPFTEGMTALIQSKLTPQTAHEAMVTARRFGGEEALSRDIVDRAVPEDHVRATAMELAAQHAAKAGPALGTIKTRMYAETVKALTDPSRQLP